MEKIKIPFDAEENDKEFVEINQEIVIKDDSKEATL